MSNIKKFLKIFVFTIITIASLDTQAEDVFGYNLLEIKDELQKIVTIEKNSDNIEEIKFNFYNEDGVLKPILLKLYGSKTTVFRLIKFPEIVFKPSVKKENRVNLRRGDAQSRIENHFKVKQIIEENNLDRLALPETVFFEMSIENNHTLQVIAEKKANLNHFVKKEYQEDLSLGYKYFYKRFKDNAELEPTFRDLFRQLALYICKTGFWDVQANNIPLDMEQKKTVLVDINDLFNYHNITDYDIRTKTILGIINLIEMADERFITDILEVAQKQINLGYKDLLYTFEKEAYYISISKEKREKLIEKVSSLDTQLASANIY